jgi:oligo-1,6-glucosidase
MQWDASPNAGFTTGTPWMPVNPNTSRINAQVQVQDPESVFAWYRALIAMRHRDAVVRDGRFELLLPADTQVYAFTRTLATERLLVVANFSSEPVSCALDLDGAVELCNYREPVTDHLRPWEVRIYRQRVR